MAAKKRPTKAMTPAELEKARLEGNTRAAQNAFVEARHTPYSSRLAFSNVPEGDPLVALLRPIMAEFSLLTKPGSTFAGVSGFGAIDAASKTIFLNPSAPGRISVDQYRYVVAHLAAHLGLEHHRDEGDVALRQAQEVVVDALIASLGLVEPPEGYQPSGLVADDPERLAAQIRSGALGHIADFTMAGPGQRDHLYAPDAAEFDARMGEGFEALLGVRLAALRPALAKGDVAEEARRHIVNNYPLLAAMARQINIVTDRVAVRGAGVELAAVNPTLGEIYLSVTPDLTLREAIFLLGHELLHLGLRHANRLNGRDPYIWNLACFPAGTWIGDHSDVIENVATMKRDYEGELLEVDSAAGTVECTPEHPFFARRRLGKAYPIRTDEPEWVEAKELRVGDYVLVPKLADTVNDEVIDLRSFIREGADGLGRKTFGNRAMKEILLTEEAAWLIGLYVAEGSSSPNAKLSLGTHETDLIARAVAAFASVGSHASTKTYGSSTAVNSGASVFGRWLKLHCGANAHEKRIPRVILYHSNPKIRHAFLKGLIDGDGHVRKQTVSSTTVSHLGSVSRRLIADLVLLLAQDGIGGAYSVMHRGPRMIGLNWTNAELILHQLHWNPEGAATSSRFMNGHLITSRSNRWRLDERGVWYRVRKVSSRPFKGPVYNITTPSHTYIANGLLVHNCDFVINGWLLGMGVGAMPQRGLLYDPALAGLSADAIYDLLSVDPAKTRRLRSFRGLELGDIIYEGSRVLVRGDVTSLDDAYATALRYGLDAHNLRYGTRDRGTLPADLEEEINSLDVDPVAWDVALARWFEEFVRGPLPVRTYARASRRQSSSPDIPRPRWYTPDVRVPAFTFGVVLDSSGSMDRETLARALGAIASYAQERDVTQIRLVMCDAMPYDEGYVDPDTLRRSFPVKGRGGTFLSPAVNLLLASADFPPDAPILVITDGGFEDELYVPRTHAWVLPRTESWWPFRPDGSPVFRVL
jgi:predicted metal-dependent peptidase